MGPSILNGENHEKYKVGTIGGTIRNRKDPSEYGFPETRPIKEVDYGGQGSRMNVLTDEEQ